MMSSNLNMSHGKVSELVSFTFFFLVLFIHKIGKFWLLETDWNFWLKNDARFEYALSSIVWYGLSFVVWAQFSKWFEKYKF